MHIVNIAIQTSARQNAGIRIANLIGGDVMGNDAQVPDVGVIYIAEQAGIIQGGGIIGIIRIHTQIGNCVIVAVKLACERSRLTAERRPLFGQCDVGSQGIVFPQGRCRLAQYSAGSQSK